MTVVENPNPTPNKPRFETWRITLVLTVFTSRFFLNSVGGHHQRGRHDGGAVLVLHRGVHREGESGGVQGIVRLISSTQRVPFISLLSHRYINHTEEIN